MEGAERHRKRRQIGLGEHAAGGVLVEEGVARLAFDQGHEGERRRPVAEIGQGDIDAALRQRLAQRRAEEIGRQPAEDPVGTSSRPSAMATLKTEPPAKG